MLKNKKAESVSRLVIIVTLILVAAIVSAVILNVGFSLDNKAVRVAERSENYAALALNVYRFMLRMGENSKECRILRARVQTEEY